MACYAFKSRKYWVAKGDVNGQKYDLSLKIPIVGNPKRPPQAVQDAENALREELLLRQALVAQPSETASVAPATMETLERFFFALKVRIRTDENMLHTYRVNWRTLRAHFPTVESCSTRIQLEEYVSKRLATPVARARTPRMISPRTVRKELTVLFAAWDECVEQKVALPPRPGRPKNIPKEAEKVLALSGKYRPPTVLRAFIAALATQEAKDRATLIMHTGLRVEETNRLRRDFIMKRGTLPGLVVAIYLPKEATKKRKGRWIGLNQPAWEAFERSVPFDHADPKTAFRSATDKLGPIETENMNITCRDIRHSFSTGCLDHGASQTAINGVMGHAPDMSSTYQSATATRLALVANAALGWARSGEDGSKCASLVQGENVVLLRPKSKRA